MLTTIELAMLNVICGNGVDYEWRELELFTMLSRLSPAERRWRLLHMLSSTRRR